MLKTRATRIEFPEIFSPRAGCVSCVTFQLDVAIDTRDLAQRKVVGDCLTQAGSAARESADDANFLVRVDLVEANEPTAVLVPERKAQRRHAGSERHDRRHVHERILIVTALQPVVRNARCQVMNVVQSDVTCEPSQRRRELEVPRNAAVA